MMRLYHQPWAWLCHVSFKADHVVLLNMTRDDRGTEDEMAKTIDEK